MLSVVKRTKANYFEKRRHQKKIKKSLIRRVHDNTEPLPDFVARPLDKPNVPSFCGLDQLLSGILQILKRCILYNYRVKSAKNGKVLIPEDFHTAFNCN